MQESEAASHQKMSRFGRLESYVQGNAGKQKSRKQQINGAQQFDPALHEKSGRMKGATVKQHPDYREYPDRRQRGMSGLKSQCGEKTSKKPWQHRLGDAT